MPEEAVFQNGLYRLITLTPGGVIMSRFKERRKRSNIRWDLCPAQVRLRLSGVHTGWSGALRFGFTSLDPSELTSAEIPKYACPDLVTRPGYWAKALPERLAQKDNVLSFWADRHGRVFYSINEGEPILFHCGLSIGCPLWAIVDIYGITQEVTLLGERPLAFVDVDRPGPTR